MASLSCSEQATDWATLLSKSVLCNNGSLDFHPPKDLGGVNAVYIMTEDVSTATNKWNCSLIAQILGIDSSLNAVKKFAETKWNDFGLLEVLKLDKELFIFRFQSEESKIKVLEEPLVSYGSKMMFLKPWVPDKPIEKLTLRTVPIWIKLPGLGLQYFSLQALSKLGSLVGRPLFVDIDTADQSRLAYARICVEINAEDELPNEMFFLNEFCAGIDQRVEYEWVPPRCTFCKIFGHDTNLCTRKSSPDLKAEGDSHDMKSEQPGINADNEKVDQKVFCKDEGESQEKSFLLEEKACRCGSKKEYNACCGSVSGRSSCKDEGGSQEKKTLLPEEKACPCGSKKEYNACCGSVSGRSSCKDEGGSQEKKTLLPEEKACPCGSKKEYNACCGSVSGRSSCKVEGGSEDNKTLLPEEKKISRNKPCPCGSKKKYKACCGSVYGRSSCKDEGESEEKKTLLPEEEKISLNKACPCGSKKKYKACCEPVSRRSSYKDEGGSEEKKSLLPDGKLTLGYKACPCGSRKRYKVCCGSAFYSSCVDEELLYPESWLLLPEEKIFSRNLASWGSNKKYLNEVEPSSMGMARTRDNFHCSNRGKIMCEAHSTEIPIDGFRRMETSIRPLRNGMFFVGRSIESNHDVNDSDEVYEES